MVTADLRGDSDAPGDSFFKSTHAKVSRTTLAKGHVRSRLLDLDRFPYPTRIPFEWLVADTSFESESNRFVQ